jgi:HEAT repeat protein
MRHVGIACLVLLPAALLLTPARPLADTVAEQVQDKPAAKPAVGPQPKTPPAVSPDEQLLMSAHLPATGPGLLQFFARRAQARPDAEAVHALIRRLGDAQPEARDQAMGELVSLGHAAVPLLRRAANDLDDPEAAERARRCLQALEGPSGAALSTAAARVLALHRPAGAVAALLNYLPFAEDDKVVDEIRDVLAGLAWHKGELAPALAQALEDNVPVRRAVAGEVLAQVGPAEQQQAARRLLRDVKPTVRLRVATALAGAQDPEAVPVLIGLLSELPADQARQAEEYLLQLAGDWAVAAPPGHDELTRRLRRDLWAAWWRSLDGPALVQEFRKRTLPDAQRDQIQELIKYLGDPSPEQRDRAFGELQQMGRAALTQLRLAENGSDPWASGRARQLLQLMEKDAAPTLSTAAARLIALRKPEGAAEALLAYLPGAEDETMAGEVRSPWPATAATRRPCRC